MLYYPNRAVMYFNTLISRAAELLDHLDRNLDSNCEDEYCMEFRAKCRNLLLTMEIHIVHKQQK